MSEQKADNRDRAPKAPVELNDDEVARAQAGTGPGGLPFGRPGSGGPTLGVESSDTIETVKQR